MSDVTEEAMVQVVSDAEAGRLSLDEAEAMMAYLKASPWNPPRTFGDAYFAVAVRQGTITGLVECPHCLRWKPRDALMCPHCGHLS